MQPNPIGFSIHESLVVKAVPKKKKLLAHIIPGKLETYIFTTQEEYNQDYQDSFFAVTCKKSGWDCFRHYEILANGCIPLFINLESIPKNIMTFFPKDIISQTNKLYITMKNSENFMDYEETCNQYISKLLEHTRSYLTTKNMAKYILTQSGFDVKNVKNVLFLSGDTSPDYLRCLTLIGFKDLFGKNCHDFPKIPHIYEDYENIIKLYGKGINYSRKVNCDDYDETLDRSIIKNIKSHFYDVVIYGSVHRGSPLDSLVLKNYKKNEVVLLCGEDSHKCQIKDNYSSGVNFFIREFE